MYRTESLKKLALLGAIEKPVKISSSEFTRYTSTSSKTAARVLKLLEDEQYIERQLVTGGQMIQMREKGVNLLKNEYAEYQIIFCKDHDDLDLYGTVITGLGEGQYYISRDGYMSQFRDKLDFKPFPGTLNVRLDGASTADAGQHDFHQAGSDPWFQRCGNAAFGGGKCYPVEIEGIRGAVIIPDRTHYPADLLEIIAPVNLRGNARDK